MKTVNILLAATLAALAHPALAQAQGTPRTDAREERQQQRIGEGVKSRQLTRKEAARLEKGQARVEKMEAKAAADGKVTKKERARLEKAQDRESRNIARERHDKQRAKR